MKPKTKIRKIESEVAFLRESLTVLAQMVMNEPSVQAVLESNKELQGRHCSGGYHSLLRIRSLTPPERIVRDTDRPFQPVHELCMRLKLKRPSLSRSEELCGLASEEVESILRGELD